MRNLKIDLNNLHNDGLKELFQSLEEAFKVLDVDFYLIGALARDIWFLGNSQSRVRGTKDVDFAVFIARESQFEELKEYLITHKGFRVHSTNSFVFFSPKNIQIDILPFGQLEVEDGVTVSGKGLTSIKVNGFKEVYESGTNDVTLFEEKIYKIATLPSIVLLKLISYDDRPEVRIKDPEDILSILKYYFDLNDEFVFDNHPDTLELIDNGQEWVAARVIGREIASIISQNEKLKLRVLSILERETNPESRMAEIMTRSNDKYSVDTCVGLLKNILEGIHERIK
ncbi:MAG TPA: hypothetical protein VK766_12140 [Cytophagaceae bacterium]|jgi:predicted nucleotidyltransferase|nr:hypothetical protein [Cytophagaceae bacterium]